MNELFGFVLLFVWPGFIVFVFEKYFSERLSSVSSGKGMFCMFSYFLGMAVFGGTFVWLLL